MDLADRELKCAVCGEMFVFSAGEQEFFQGKWFVNEPKYYVDHNELDRNRLLNLQTIKLAMKGPDERSLKQKVDDLHTRSQYSHRGSPLFSPMSSLQQ